MGGIRDPAVAQMAVIGSMLMDERCIGPTLGQIGPLDFSWTSYRTLYFAIRQLFGEGKPVDPVTVLDVVKTAPGEDWYQLIRAAMEQTPSAANIELYIPILKDDARLSRINALGTKLAEVKDMDTARGAIQALNADMVDKPGVRAVSMEQGLSEFFDRQHTKEQYLSWGFEAVDRMVYVSKGKFVLLGGYASHGKTAFALQLAMGMAKDHRVGFYSLETDDATIHDRLVASTARVSMSKIKRRELDQGDYDAVAAVSQRYISRQLEVVQAAGWSVDEIFAYAQSRRHEIIFVDYIQIISGRGRNRTEVVTDVSRSLAIKIRMTGITVIGLSQLTRPEKEGGKRKAPRMSDLRESGQLEQDADVVMLLYAENPDDLLTSRRVLTVEKNKEGVLGQMYLQFDGDTQVFLAHRNQAPLPKRREPEYKQTTFEELAAPDPDDPFDKEGQ